MCKVGEICQQKIGIYAEACYFALQISLLKHTLHVHNPRMDTETERLLLYPSYVCCCRTPAISYVGRPAVHNSKKIRWKMKDERGGWFAWAAMGLILPTSAKQMGRRESNRLIKMTQPNEHEWGEVYCTSTAQARTFRFRHIYFGVQDGCGTRVQLTQKKSLCSFVQPLFWS